MNVLHAALGDGDVRLVPLGEPHREALRAACAADDAIWEIYPVDLRGEAFDPGFAAMLANAARLPFAVIAGRTIVGTTSYLSPSPADRVVEIGGTYLAPEVRGGGVNDAMKRLMIDHAIACGYHRIEFRVDVRNRRSMAAVAKLGARLEGVMRRQRITWTGHVRDTALYSLLPEEWAARSAAAPRR